MKKTIVLLCLTLSLLLLATPAQAQTADTLQMLVNKTYMLDRAYIPENLVDLDEYMAAGSRVQLQREAAEAMGRMVRAAAEAGITDIYGQSGYRSYSTQSGLYSDKTAYYRSQGYGAEEAAARAATVVAPPGSSEHQSGLALDVTTSANSYSLTGSFADTTAGQWLAENCWQYGFILRYPAEKTAITGYIYEPWHFRYVGLPHAEYMRFNGLCLEEYLDLLRLSGGFDYVTGQGHAWHIYYSAQDISAGLEGVTAGLSWADTTHSSYIISMRPLLYDLEGHWSRDEVRALWQRGLISGYPDGSFGPDGNINRAELITLVQRTRQLLFAPEAQPGEAPLPVYSFSDVSQADYYFDSLMKMYAAGLVASSMVSQQPDGSLRFDGMEQVLRYQAAQSLAPLFAALPQAQTGSTQLLDMYQESPELQAAVQTLADYGVVRGDALGNFNPHAKITRAEIAAMLNRIIEYYEK